MRNHLIGFIVSALLHTSLLAGVFFLAKETVKEKSHNKNISLMVKMFEERRVVSPPKKTIVKPLSKLITKKSTPHQVSQKQEIKTALLPKVTLEEKIISPTKEEKLVPSTLTKKIIKKPQAKVLPKKRTRVIKPKKIKKKKKVVKRKITPKKTKPKTTKAYAPHHQRVMKKVVTKKVVYKKQRSKVVRPRVPIRASSKIAKRIAQKKSPRYNTKRTLKKVQSLQRNRTKKGVRKNALKRVVKKVTPTRSKANTSQKYKSQLHQLIESYSKKHYPKRAKKKGEQGRVTISFTIQANGSVSNVQVVRSSNSRTLDNAAIRAVKFASRRLPYPHGMAKKPLVLSITLQYILR